jgi:hypothetical protein
MEGWTEKAALLLERGAYVNLLNLWKSEYTALLRLLDECGGKVPWRMHGFSTTSAEEMGPHYLDTSSGRRRAKGLFSRRLPN